MCVFVVSCVCVAFVCVCVEREIVFEGLCVFVYACCVSVICLYMFCLCVCCVLVCGW